jgi:hypothetical protein
VLLVFGFFGILIPAVLLVLLPLDPAPFRRSFFALGAYALSLFGIVMLLAELVPEPTDTPEEEQPDTMMAWRILLGLLLLCLIGMIASQFIPLPPQIQDDALLMRPISVATPSAN